MRPALFLVVTSWYFDMIASGIKREEYQEVKPYWERVFVEGGNGAIKIRGTWYDTSEVDIVFACDYASDRPTVKVPCTGLRIGLAKPEWSGPEFTGKQFFILELGEIYK